MKNPILVPCLLVAGFGACASSEPAIEPVEPTPIETEVVVDGDPAVDRVEAAQVAVTEASLQVESPRRVVNAGLLYTLGRCVAYIALASLLAATALSIPAVSLFLQKYMHLVLGPILLLLGMFLVGLIATTLGATMMSEGMQKRIDAMGVWGALPLGALFAVSFCPISAGWFFGLVALIMGSEAGAITAELEKIGIVLPAASNFLCSAISE